MPFKTKRQKIAAMGRHTFDMQGKTKVSYSGDDESTKVKSSDKPPRSLRRIEASYDYVKSELVKIALLAVIVIGLQLALKVSNLPLSI